MGEDPQQLEREIERTREKLGHDIDALEEKVNPKKVAHRSVDKAKDVAREKAAEVKEKVSEVAAAAKEKVAEAREKAAEAKDTVADKVSSGSPDGGATGGTVATGYADAGSTSVSAGGLGGKVSGLVGTAKAKAGPLAVTALDKAGPLAATARDKAAPLAAAAKVKAAERVGMDPQTADTREVATAVASGTWTALLEQTRRNPALVGAVTFVLGLVIGKR